MLRVSKASALLLTLTIAMIASVCVANLNSVNAETENNITVHYRTMRSESLLFKYPMNYGSIWANGDYVYLVVNMTINNNGYNSFSTDPAYFFVVADNTNYTFDASGTYDRAAMEDSLWKTVDIPNGGTFTGTLVFQIPMSSSVSSLGYSGYYNQSQSFNIIWASITPSLTPTHAPTSNQTLAPTPTLASGEPTQTPTSPPAGSSSPASFLLAINTIALVVIAVLLTVIIALLLFIRRRKILT
jgi:Predicted solute binding protein